MKPSIPDIDIIDFTDAHSDAIRVLNYAWLEKYFRIEPGDRVALTNPRAAILDKGGFIFYARLHDAIVGTASLLKQSDTLFEVGKMAVAEEVQGFQIGTKLLEHCIAFARQRGIRTLILYSNTKLAAAIHLYRKYGFVEIPLEAGLYERADIKMEKHL
jgi:GNAT superfamily N-acetyltransferase